MKILELEKLVSTCADAVHTLELEFLTNRIDDYSSFEIEIADARAQHSKLSESLC